jgi:hypothetical protein
MKGKAQEENDWPPRVDVTLLWSDNGKEKKENNNNNNNIGFGFGFRFR